MNDIYKIRKISESPSGKKNFGITIPTHLLDGWVNCYARFEQSGNALIMHRVILSDKK